MAVTAPMPQGIALSPDATNLAVLESGDGPAGVRILDAATLRERSYTALKGAFGRPVWDGNGHLWVALANLHGVAYVNAAGGLERTIDLGETTWPSAVALSPDARHLAFSDDASAHVGIIDLQTGTVEHTIPTDKHPGDLAFSPDAQTLAVANSGASTVTLVNVASARAQTVDAGYHPAALAFAQDGTRLYVALADDDAVAVLNPARGTVTTRIPLGLADGAGASPNALAIGADGRIFVSCGALNAVAVLAGGKRAGLIAAGWYPSGVATAQGQLYIANGKGEKSRPNPQYNPFAGKRDGYVATSLSGSVRKVALQNAIQTENVLRNVEQIVRAPAGTVVRTGGPIKHVIYVIKENRTYDQVLSDLPGGDGDPSLLLFGAAVTPNQHAIAKRFGLFDRAFSNAQVSADGHNWTDAAFANDYLERFWPVVYANRRFLYDFEDGADAATPRNGYLWDAAARAHISYRNYGEFVTNPSTTGSEVTTQEANLKGHTSTAFPGFDMEFSDLDRVAIWMRDFRNDARSGMMPTLQIIRLPNDHTSGTKPGSLTPEAYVAQNDYALGQVIDAVSHSKFWRSTAIFALEDDAQNGPDHVDDQRTTFYVASPYARGGVDHSHYSTAGVVRTIELILGLHALSTYDAHARPMYAAFGRTANVKPFTAVRPEIDLKAVNKKTAYGAERSAAMNFHDADRVDPAQLNEILYRDHARRVRR
jgi:YVTN family beta-propeller protein